ncbi:hypothetical protein PtB15_3B331 [Puccinia triticina]|nr:hypothetical protein PtB15_3B331 [Puccinia triticina]
MQFFGLLLCTLMSLSVLTAPNGRTAARQRRSLDNEIKKSWMMQKRAADAPKGAVPAADSLPDLKSIVGGDVTQADFRNLLTEFLKSPVTPGARPTVTLVGKAKATEMLTRLETAQKSAKPEQLSPKAAQTFLRMLKRFEGKTGEEVPKSTKPARRAAPPPTTPTAAGTKTGMDLLKAWVASLPEVQAATSTTVPATAPTTPVKAGKSTGKAK